MTTSENDKGLNVVCGMPRSGTSLVMGILMRLGADIAGEAMPDGVHTEANPEFWEVVDHPEFGAVAINGMPRLTDEFAGRTVKLTCVAMRRTPAKIIDRMVLCVRDPRQVLASQRLLDPRKPEAVNAARYVQEMGSMVLWLLRNWNGCASAWDALPVMAVEYELLLSDTLSQVERLLFFFGLDSTQDQVDEAVAFVDPALHHHREPGKWREDEAVNASFADDIHAVLSRWARNALPGGIWGALERFSDPLQYALAQMDLEQMARWVDDTEFGTYAVMQPDMFRMLRTVPARATEMVRATYETQCCSCAHHSRILYDLYRVNRPADLGDLLRPRVRCAVDTDKPMTLEECKQCFDTRRKAALKGGDAPPVIHQNEGVAG